MPRRGRSKEHEPKPQQFSAELRQAAH